jgi:hypothetical protein
MYTRFKNVCPNIFASLSRMPKSPIIFGKITIGTAMISTSPFIDFKVMQNKEFFEKNPKLMDYVESYKKDKIIKIDKKKEECVQEIKLFEEIGIPKKDIYVLSDVPSSNLFKIMGIGSSVFTSVIISPLMLYGSVLTGGYFPVVLSFLTYSGIFVVFTGIGKAIDVSFYGYKKEYLALTEC